MAKSQRTRDVNPTGEAYRNMEDDGRRFLILHDGVGTHRREAVVSARDFGEAADIDRLVRLGAVREVSQSETDLLERFEEPDPTDPQFQTGNPHTEPLGSDEPDKGEKAPPPPAKPAQPSAPAKPVEKK